MGSQPTCVLCNSYQRACYPQTCKRCIHDPAAVTPMLRHGHCGPSQPLAFPFIAFVPCRFGENELASLSYSIALASAPVEGTVFGTNGRIHIHDALHHSTRLSVQLAGGSAAWLQLSGLSCWCHCTRWFDWQPGHAEALPLHEPARPALLAADLPHQPAHRSNASSMAPRGCLVCTSLLDHDWASQWRGWL